MPGSSVSSLWYQVFSTIKAYPVPILLSLAILNLLWNKFQPDLVRISGPTLAAYTKWWRFYNVYRKQAHLTAIELHQKYGPLVRIAPNVVSVGDPKMIPVIYTNKEEFTKVSKLCDWVLNWHIIRGFLTHMTHRPVSILFNASRGRKNQK